VGAEAAGAGEAAEDQPRPARRTRATKKDE
jgi:hypothetical protein